MPREASRRIETTTLPDQLFIGIQGDDMGKMPEFFGASMGTLCEVFASYPEMNHWSHRPPVALYKMTPTKLLFRAGFVLSVKEAAHVLVNGKNTDTLLKELQAKNIVVHSIAGGSYVKWLHVGPYDKLADTWTAMKNKAKEEGVLLDINPWISWESYVTEPGSEPDTNKWETEIFCRILSQ